MALFGNAGIRVADPQAEMLALPGGTRRAVYELGEIGTNGHQNLYGRALNL